MLEVIRSFPIAYYVYYAALLFVIGVFGVLTRRNAIVVEEYGERMGKTAPDDHLDQVVGEYTTRAPGHIRLAQRQSDGSVLVDGGMNVRDLVKLLQVSFPLDGPKTVNGLIVEYFQDIPEPGTCFRLSGCVFEVLQTQARGVKRVRITPPA